MVFNWHPTKLFKDRCNMVEFLGSGHYAGTKVLIACNLLILVTEVFDHTLEQ